MARKNTHVYIVKEFILATLNADVDNFSDPTECNWMDNIGILLKWAGAPVGAFEIYVSNKDLKPTTAAEFTKLDFGAPITIDATESEHLISINQIPFKWIALKYAFTSGTGTMSVVMNSKQVGG